MPIEDVFSISGRGTVVTGRVERGIKEEVEIVGIKATTKTTCTGVEMFRKLLDEGRAGENVGILLRGTKREDVERGQVLAKPGTIKPHTKFECEVYVLSKDSDRHGRWPALRDPRRRPYRWRRRGCQDHRIISVDLPFSGRHNGRPDFASGQ